MTSERRLDRGPSLTPSVGLLMAMLDDARLRTLERLDDLDASVVDQEAPGLPNTIGTLLYHLAAIELDWLYVEILGEDFPADTEEWFQVDVRDGSGNLSRVTGEDLDQHRARLAWVRGLFHERMQGIDDAYLSEPRPTDGGTVTSEWVFHHLMQHEAEHRGQIGEILQLRSS